MRGQDGDQGESKGETSTHPRWLSPVRFAVALAIFLGGPFLCRAGDLEVPTRCIVVAGMVLLLNICEIMPLFCVALALPVMGTMCAVLGEDRGTRETSILLVANVFNQTSFLVLGALVINAIFAKCGLDRRLMHYLLSILPLDSARFLLALMMGGMAACSVLYSGSIMLLGALRPFIKDNRISPAAAKRLLLGVAFASNAGSTWLPISSPVNLIAIEIIEEFDHKITPLGWALVSIPVSTLTILLTWMALVHIFPHEEVSEAEEPPIIAHQMSTSGFLDRPVIARQVSQDVNKARDEEASLSEIKAGAALAASGAVEQGIPTPRPSGGEGGVGTTSSAATSDIDVEEQLTRSHYTFMIIGLCAVLGIVVFAEALEPLIGHPACISLTLVVITFGSGFMSRDEFISLDWDLLATVGGTNVMAFLVRETGLGKQLAAQFLGTSGFSSLPFWCALAVLIIGTVTLSTFLQHSLSGVIVLPLIVAVGVKLNAAETVCTLCAVVIPLGMALPTSSFDNATAHTVSRTLNRKPVELSQRDFAISGGFTAFVGAMFVLTVGYWICIAQYGIPPPLVVSKQKTPKELKPKVVSKKYPWEKSMDERMKDFDKRPEHKAFAVEDSKDSHKKGAKAAWGAAWGRPSQIEANRAALRQCELIADKCRLVYPDPIAEANNTESQAHGSNTTLLELRHRPPRKRAWLSRSNLSVPWPRPSLITVAVQKGSKRRLRRGGMKPELGRSLHVAFAEQSQT